MAAPKCRRYAAIAINGLTVASPAAGFNHGYLGAAPLGLRNGQSDFPAVQPGDVAKITTQS